MDTDSISEPMFLLTELRYTLGQLQVQLTGLDLGRQDAQPGTRSIDDILAEMASTETEYQQKYARILGLPASEAGKEEASIPLPIDETEEAPQRQAHLERERAHTIALLERSAEPWPADLLDTAKAQVAQDRAFTTQIAEARREQLESRDRGKLDQPLSRPDESTESSA